MPDTWKNLAGFVKDAGRPRAKKSCTVTGAQQGKVRGPKPDPYAYPVKDPPFGSDESLDIALAIGWQAG